MNRYRAFVGDLHGSIEALDSALSKVDLNNTDIYFLGDYVDRGANSKLVLEKLKYLTDNYSTIHCIMGNHDKMLLDFVYLGDNLGFLNDPQLNTLNSFFSGGLKFDGSYDIYNSHYRIITKEIRNELTESSLIKWLLKLPAYIETDKQIIVHAGIDKELDNWKDTSNEDFMWIRPNLMIPNKTGKDIIVGHTMTYKFQDVIGSNQPDIYISPKTNEYFIDTANYQYGNAKVLLYDTKYNKYSIIE